MARSWGSKFGGPLACAALACCLPSPAGAVDAVAFPQGTFFTVSSTNRLERFTVAAPGERLSSLAFTGLASGDDILAIDFRPATGELYALGSSSKLYVVDPATGAGTKVVGLLSPLLSGTDFGFDFDPVLDRIRIVSDAEQNLSVNPDTAVVSVGTPLGPAGNVVAAAYTNNFAGATATALFDVDSAFDALLTQNNGTLSLVGVLGVDINGAAGFDIVSPAAGGNTAYAILTTSPSTSALYTINLTTGAATLVGALGTDPGVAARALAFPAGPETIYGVTVANRLLRFRSNAPGAILAAELITGLQPGESVLGIDFRPATGELYGLGSTSRLYRIDPTTAAATQVGAGALSVPLNGTEFGFDFNPQADLVWIVSDAEQNLRINADTAAVTVQPVLNPAGNVVAAAFTNNVAGAASTALYDIDSATDLLLGQTPPDSGTLTTVGPLGVDASGKTGLDIAPNGSAFASVTLQGAATTNLYRVNLGTGAATLVGAIGGGEVVRDTAIRIYTEVAYAVTQTAGPAHSLIRFNPATPVVVVSSVPITGLQAGEAVLGIDFRLADSTLYALGSTSRLYRVNLSTGAASALPAPPAPYLSGSSFGVDFDPVSGLLRVVSDTEQNLRVNADTGAVQVVDTPLVPAGNVVAAAYTNNFAGATATALFDVDSAFDALLTQNNGTLSLVGVLGVDIGPSAGFDIGSLTGYAYLAAYLPAATNPSLFRVNLATGAATLIDSIGTADTLVGFAIAMQRDPLIFANGFE